MIKVIIINRTDEKHDLIIDYKLNFINNFDISNKNYINKSFNC